MIYDQGVVRRRRIISPSGGFFANTGGTAGASTTTWNPSDKDADAALSNGNLTVTESNASPANFAFVRSVGTAATGKKYWEITATTINAGGTYILGASNGSELTSHFVGQSTASIGTDKDGNVFYNGGVLTTIQTFVAGNVVCIALDIDNGKIWWRTNAGNWNNNGANDPATNTGGITVGAAGALFAAVSAGGGLNNALTANFGGSAYSQTAPSGFGNW